MATPKDDRTSEPVVHTGWNMQHSPTRHGLYVPLNFIHIAQAMDKLVSNIVEYPAHVSTVYGLSKYLITQGRRMGLMGKGGNKDSCCR